MSAAPARRPDMLPPLPDTQSTEPSTERSTERSTEPSGPIEPSVELTESGPAPGAGDTRPANGPIAPRPGWTDRLGFGPTMSLRKRIGLLAALAAGVSVLIVSVATYWTVRMSLSRQLDATLMARAEVAARSDLSDPDAIRQVTTPVFGASDVRIELLDGRTGIAIHPKGSGSLPDLDRSGSNPGAPTPEENVANRRSPRSVRTVPGYPGDSTLYRVVAIPVGGSAPMAFVIAQPLTDNQNLVNRLGALMAGLSAAGVALAAWAGFAVARSGLRPIEDLTEGAELVARTGELRPVPVRGSDELARLARSFNTMLAALGSMRERERRLVADAGHELRTPLTSLRTNIDLLAQSDAAARGAALSDEDRRALIGDLRAQIEELTDLITDLVELSREPASELWVEIDLAEVVQRSVERVRRRAPHLRFAVDTSPWPMLGDPQLLDRAVTNLLDNAAKWSPAGGTVSVSLHEGVLNVADQGAGISRKDLPHIFDRFYRADEARATPGSGLGLSIVAQAATRHGGSVTAGRSPAGGAEFVVRLPHQPPAAPRIGS